MTEMTPIRIGSSGSYDPSDVTFLLKQVEMQPTARDAKETAIQSGAKHYSEMISDEARPDETYLQIFRDAWAAQRDRFANDVVLIAGYIRDLIARGEMPLQITLCSLVRAGVPLGVLLKRELERQGIDVAHFGVSIIRDRGIDEVAMAHVAEQRDIRGVLFVDGWTGKGAISTELTSAWQKFAGRDPFLVVLADPCGRASLAGSREDWLIPTGLLGANISGLVSRSILNSDVVGPGDFHGFIPVGHLADIDMSRAFVDDISARAAEMDRTRAVTGKPVDHLGAEEYRDRSEAAVAAIMDRFTVNERNFVKPGIAEATRAVLRRKPDLVLLRNTGDADLQGLIHLCEQNDVRMVVAPELTGPYRAVTIIGKA
jgi:hypothetical protein